MCGKVVAYYRVSTDRQGRSGLGLEAQQSAVAAFVRERGGQLVQEFTEVESGKVNARPELDRAIRLAELTGAKLVIAKLDRLSRNAGFLFNLRDSGVQFIALDVPEVTTLNVGILSTLAQHEREVISARTKAALAAAKRNGRKLGHKATLVPGAVRERAVEAARAKAATKRKKLAQKVAELQQAGFTSPTALVKELERLGVETPRGKGEWSVTQVSRLLGR